MFSNCECECDSNLWLSDGFFQALNAPIRFRPRGALPRTSLGQLTTLPTSSRLGGTPPPRTFPLSTPKCSIAGFPPNKFEDVLVCDLVLLTLLFLSLSTEHVVFLCVLRVLAVFGLNSALIFSLIIIIIIIKFPVLATSMDVQYTEDARRSHVDVFVYVSHDEQ